MAALPTLSRRERAPLVTDAIPPSLRRGGATPRQVLVLCLVGAIVLALFASRDTPGWAERRGDSALDHLLAKVRRAVEGAGLLARAVYVERGTMPDERILPLAECREARGAYFAMVLIPGEGRRL